MDRHTLQSEFNHFTQTVVHPMETIPDITQKGTNVLPLTCYGVQNVEGDTDCWFHEERSLGSLVEVYERMVEITDTSVFCANFGTVAGLGGMCNNNAPLK